MAWQRFLDRKVEEHIEQHNAGSVEDRTRPGDLEALHRLMGDANAALEMELRRIRDRLAQLTS